MTVNKRKRKFKAFSKAALIRLGVLLFILLGVIGWLWFTCFQMPGNSYSGQFLPLTAQEKIIQDNLQKDINKLAIEIGARNYNNYENINTAADFLKSSFQEAGYQVNKQEYKIDNKTFTNLEVEIKGVEKPDEIVIIGGHYDTAFTSPGANDNGSGVAAVLELARRFADKKPNKTLRFVEFTNEEPPYFWTENMGSLVYAKGCKERNENVVAMLSLETMGYFSEEEGSQKYPFPLNLIYPSQGNFIAFVGDINSSWLVKKTIDLFRKQVQFQSEGVAIFGQIPGVGWSDHWSFWEQDYQALMVTDTAPFRYKHYHTLEDIPDKIDYEKFARVVAGLEKVVGEFVR
ncbi:putative aminopeptidase [Rivularia sp. PCC 7116]|uniref:M28 family peptidase n=1 Tax=Rivularia sp. PCC 7116 TaxID=373994 RepID=UPI00029F27E1|nr:M28 family peptidase [Rivularia sp. PCC 7116]AFY53179.1 putative aminopeptidase [Rivularia sp. PCC 7116]